MKKKISLPDQTYRKKLLNLIKFYKIKEIKENLLKRKLTNKQIELLLKKNNIALPKSLSEDFRLLPWKVVYKSLGVAAFLIFIFGSLPLIVNNANNNSSKKFIKSEQKIDQANNKFKVILDKNKKQLDQSEEDVAFFDNDSKDITDNTVRLSASTLEEIFESSGYNLDNVRKTKKVKPIYISILPSEIGQIENTEKRKGTFIKIILPLVLNENKQIKSDRKKLFRILGKKYNNNLEKKWLKKKFKKYNIKNSDLSELKIRMDIIPVSLAIAQAAKETGWGTSRFAQEGNALFGQWTYSEDGLQPLDNTLSKHKVKRFNLLQASVTAYKKNLNTHKVYNKFRLARAELREKNEKINSLVLVKYLNKYAETGDNYTKILEKIIKQNKLMDFDNAKLLPTRLIINQNI